MIGKIFTALKIKTAKDLLVPTQNRLTSAKNILQGMARSDEKHDSSLTIFKEIAEDTEILEAVERFSDEMEIVRGAAWLHHAEDVLICFHLAASAVPEQKVLDLANAFKLSMLASASFAAIGPQAPSPDRVFDGMHKLSERCPTEQKLDLFKVLDSSTDLSRLLPLAGDVLKADYITSALKGIDTDIALQTLRASNAWPLVPKTENLTECIAETDRRFLPAMHF